MASRRGMNACSDGFARKSIAMLHVASVCSALYLWKLCQLLWHFWTTLGAFWEAIGQNIEPSAKGDWSSTKTKALGQVFVADRHWIWSIDHLFLWKAPVAAAEGKQNMPIHLQDNVCTTTPLIMFKTQRCVVLDPRTTNHAFQCMMAKGAKCATQYQLKCTKEHIRGPQPLSCLSRGNGIHTQCNAT